MTDATHRGLTATEVEVKLAEYGHAQSMLQHYDNLNWQIGSILIGANAVLLGLTANLVRSVGWWGLLIAVAISVFSFVLLQAWRLWFRRHKDLYDFRNETLHRIETQLGMYHFLRVVETEAASRLSDAQVAERAAARTVAYALDDGRQFEPFYAPQLHAPGGSKLAYFLSYFVPAAVLVALVAVVVAFNA